MNTKLQTTAAKAISIEQEVENIFKLLTSNAAENTVVVKERAPIGKACKAFIYAYKRSDLLRQNAKRQNTRNTYAKAMIKPTLQNHSWPSRPLSMLSIQA